MVKGAGRRISRRHPSTAAPRITRVETAFDTAPIIGPVERPEQVRARRLPRLARHSVTLSGGHEVGVAVCGQGVPLVLVHGFTAEGILYAQTLSRLVGAGFRVVAIDTAGHGGTLGLPTEGANMEEYTKLLARVLDKLGIRRAILAGHSMGGRLVADLAAREPERAIAVVLLDAIVGDTWDRMVNVFRVAPPLLVGLGGVLIVDSVTTLPLFRDPVQARKLSRLITPVIAGHVRRPWRMLGPALSILRSRGSGSMLDRIAEEQIPLIVIHGERDIAVPMATAHDSAARGHGTLVTVEKAGHSWLLRDPRTLPTILDALVVTNVGEAIMERITADVGVAGRGYLDQLTVEEVDDVYLDEDALLYELSPPPAPPDVMPRDGLPRYRWRVKEPVVTPDSVIESDGDPEPDAAVSA